MNESLESFCCDFTGILTDMTQEQVQAHPESDFHQWNAQQLVEHLVLTYRSSSRVLEDRLQKGRPTKAQADPEQQARRDRLFGTGIFPDGGDAPERVRPGQMDISALSGVELAALLRKEMEVMDGLIDHCHAIFGQQPMASHFAYGPLCADEWRRFHVLHGRHHLKQLEKITRTISG